MVDPVKIKQNIEKLKEHVLSLCQRHKRNPEEITIIAVSKTHPKEAIISAVESGICDIGENRVQEAYKKWQELPSNIKEKMTFHMIGYLQRNKAKRALQIFDIIQSVDRIPLVDVLYNHCIKDNKTAHILIEVNTSGEETKHGVSPDEAERLLEYILNKAKVFKVLGLMTVGPLTEDEKKIGQSFFTLRRLKEDLEQRFNIKLPHLSMGMTDDYHIAIAEGSTMIRIGRAIFGERNY